MALHHPLSLIVAASCLAFCASPDNGPDPIFASQLSFTDARSSALASAGCALPGGVTTAYLNPALPNPFNLYNGVNRAVLSGAYGRDSLFSGHIFPLGADLFLKEHGTVGMLCRYLRTGDTRRQYEAVLNYSGRLFDKSMNQGAVDYGVNMRVERLQWTDSLAAVRYARALWKPRDTVLVWDSVVVAPPAPTGNRQEDHLFFDLGFFQRDVAEHVDFGLTIHNLLGYVWLVRRPGVTRQEPAPDTSDLDSTRVVARDTLFYTGEVASRDWLASYYRGVTVGIAVHAPIMDNKATLVIPADLGFVGVFNRSLKTRLLLRLGAEVSVSEHYVLRLGYASAPTNISLHDLTTSSSKLNRSLLSGGAGMKLDRLSADLYIGNSEWGVTVTAVL